MGEGRCCGLASLRVGELARLRVKMAEDLS